MKKETTELFENLAAIISTFDVATEHQDFISGKVKWKHEGVLPSGVLMMAVTDTAFSLKRLIQFINLSDAGTVLHVDANMPSNKEYINAFYSGGVVIQEAIAQALQQVVDTKGVVDEGVEILPDTVLAPVKPLIDEQLAAVGKHRRIAESSAVAIRKLFQA